MILTIFGDGSVMRRGRFAGLCGHLIEAGALVLELLLKAVDLALQTQYILLLSSQSLI